jgi:DNA processing protein
MLAALAAMAGPAQGPLADRVLSDHPIDKSSFSDDESARLEVEGLLGPEPVAVDELVRQCQLSAPSVRAALLELELAGRLERHPGNRVSLLLTNAPHR